MSSKDNLNDMISKAKSNSKVFEQKAIDKNQNITQEDAAETPTAELVDVNNEGIMAKGTTFEGLGVCSEVIGAVTKMGYKTPSKIQAESLPYTLKGRDIIGLAETGSGKTAAFAIPVIQSLLENPQPFYALVMSPTRELCVQIAEQFTAIGSLIGLRTAVLVGGLDMVS